MRAPFAIALSGTLLASVAWANNPWPFDRYRVILDRKPFGDPPPVVNAQPAQPPPDPSKSFAKSLRMSSIVRKDSGEIQVGLVDLKNNSSIMLQIGETEAGIELVDANYEDEEAVLRKGTEMAIVKLSGDMEVVNFDQQQRIQNTRSTRSSRRSRRSRRTPPPEVLARAAQNQPPPAPPQPRLTGEALTQHLQNYNMEVIRQGLPPLPIPLTPEQDAQLVTEGVLPPLE